MGACKESVCIPCLVRVTMGLLPPEWAVVGHDGSSGLYYGLLQFDHAKSGNLRIGHLAGWATCEWHHFGNQGTPPPGFTHATARDRWGVSKMDGSALFYRTYGTAQELIEIQQHVLAERGA